MADRKICLQTGEVVAVKTINIGDSKEVSELCNAARSEKTTV
jgi:hypothetical protein